MSKKKSRSVTPPPSHETSREERGREAREKGLNFEERVAEVYRLLHYDVEVGRIFSGRQVDLFLTGRFGDLIVHRAIECKLGPVNVDDLDAFIAKLRLVRRDYPSAQGTIVSAVSFSDAVAAHAHQEGIALTLFRDLSAQLLDGHQYVTQLIKACEENNRYPIRFYIEPSIGWEPSGESLTATSILKDWLGDSSWNQLTLLGDVGTGKSFLCRMLAYNLGKAFLVDPLQNPLPLLIDLRNADRQFSLEGLILTHLSNSGLSRVSFGAFTHALSHGNIVLILDGFDEMSARVSPFITASNFHELSKCVTGQAKVILTCRTHYFKSRTEEEEVILGGGQDLASESARELYWDLISRKGFRIAYLRPFSLLQIESYLQLRRPSDFRQALERIRDTYNLLELSQRPMLLEMIVKSLDKIGAADITPAALYKVYTDAWIQRDYWRDVLTAEKKLAFLTGLARTLWSEDTPRIHYTVLQEHLRLELAGELQDPQRLVEIDSEVRTASFLTRDSGGNYEFAHKSYGEFFLARWLAERLAQGELACLRLKRLSPEVISFLFDLLNSEVLEASLAQFLCLQYEPLASENALVLLYGLRRERWRRERRQVHGESTVQVRLPRGAMLTGANLNNLSLEGAVLQEADLEGASLQETILVHSDLSGSNLNRARLNSVMLIKGNLAGASLISCSLVAANLENATLDECNFSDADLTDTYLVGVSASGVKWRGAKMVGAVLSDQLSEIIQPKVPLEKMVGRGREDRNQNIAELWTQITTLLPIMRAYARRSLTFGRSIEAEDVVSEVIIEINRKQTLDKLIMMNQEGLKAYLFDAVRATALKLLSREQRHRRLVEVGVGDTQRDDDMNPADADEDVFGGQVVVLGENDEALQQVGYGENPLSILLERERAELFQKAMESTERELSEEFRTVFHRYFDEGLSAGKISEVESIPQKKVYRMLVAIQRVLLRNLESSGWP
jgi:RNA polymerase sigma factor (sigma-70 family)